MTATQVGQTYSCSQEACTITFRGGPYNGCRGLYDHSQFNQISFLQPNGKHWDSYEAKVLGRRTYHYVEKSA